MRRYWVDKQSFQGESVVLTGESYHHVHDVCRQSVGSKFEVLPGDGKAYFVEVIEEHKNLQSQWGPWIKVKDKE